jgi:hypothetical protein
VCAREIRALEKSCKDDGMASSPWVVFKHNDFLQVPHCNQPLGAVWKVPLPKPIVSL